MPPTSTPIPTPAARVDLRVRASLEACALLTARLRGLPGVEVLSESAPRPDDSGQLVRVYLRARLTTPPPTHAHDDRDRDSEVPAGAALAGALGDAAAEITAARERLAAALAAVTAAAQLHHDHGGEAAR
jgi:hypothetical protein